MSIGELIKYLDDWAPPGAAWEKDNVGLQTGSTGYKIKNIMLCLELDEKVLKESIKKKCNFIFTHHPLIFNPIKKLDTEKDTRAKLIARAIKNNITVYSAHTNLDFVKDGVSFELAKVLKLKNIRFLEQQESNQFKVVTFVPNKNLDKVAEAVFSAGGGIIGEYENCSFRIDGLGTFKGSEKSNPVIGKRESLESVHETRFEFIVDAWKLNEVISALKKSHPYEEPAYDVYPLKNKNVNYGYGTIGELEYPMNEKSFLSHAAKSIKAANLKYCSGSGKTIKTVAACGGAGGEFLNAAISNKADAFVTADIKYHSYHEAAGKILLIDAGHYETEIHSLNTVKKKIEKVLSNDKKIKVLKYSGSTNPAKFYKQ